jgi:hypothetical protein
MMSAIVVAAPLPERDADMTKKDTKVDAVSAERDERSKRAPYHPPRIAKRRAVSRATLFTGSGPDSGGVVSA